MITIKSIQVVTTFFFVAEDMIDYSMAYDDKVL